MKTLGAIFIAIIAIVVVVALGWAITGNDLMLQKFFAPKYEQVRRETFEQSKAYRQGAVQELESMMFQYVQAGPEHQGALRALILHRAADLDENTMSPQLYSFIQQLRNNKTTRP